MNSYAVRSFNRPKAEPNLYRGCNLQSEEELREFIHQTVELASTLLEQTATLKKKAGPGKSFNPYAAGTGRG